MALAIWTGARTGLLTEVLLPAFDRLPTIPDHTVIAYEPDEAVVPGDGDVCLVMGNRALKELQDAGFLRKGRKVDSMRQQAWASPEGGWWIITLDPFLTRTQADAPAKIRADIALATRLTLTGTVDPDMGEYRQVEDFSDIVSAIDCILKKDPTTKVDLACDTETLGLHPEAEGARIITIQFAVEEGKADVLFLDEDGTTSEYNVECIRWLLTHPRIILKGANWKFDSRWIHRHLGVLCTNIKRDTMLMGSMVDENRSNSLKTHAWEYTNLGGYDRLDEMGYDKARMDLVPPEILTPYAGADADVTFRAEPAIAEEMAQYPRMVNLYRKVVLPASQGFEAMEHEGVAVDLEKFSILHQDLSEEIASLEETMIDLMPRKLKLKYKDKIDEQMHQGKSPLVPNLIRDYFFTPYGLNLTPEMKTEKSGLASTAKNHLMMFEDVPEAQAFIAAFEQHSSASKTKSTFVDGFLKHLRADGRLHPTYMLFVGTMFDDDNEDSGAVTGRTSCKEPAFQTIPKKTKWAKRIRECYPAPPGKKILAFDFSQGELKVVACVAEEENMLESFRKGLDLHCVTAAAFMGITYDEFVALEKTDNFTYTLMRTGAKAGNFGLLYGMQEEGFQAYARYVYGVKMSAAETRERRNAFFDLYPGLLDYHEDQKTFVRKHKYVVSPLGRVRHLPLVDSPDGYTKSKAIRQGINAPVQSTLNDLTFYALAESRRQIPELGWFGMVHDQILAYADEDVAEELGHAHKEIMDNLPIADNLHWDHELQFTSDGEIGDNMATLSKL